MFIQSQAMNVVDARRDRATPASIRHDAQGGGGGGGEEKGRGKGRGLIESIDREQGGR